MTSQDICDYPAGKTKQNYKQTHNNNRKVFPWHVVHSKMWSTLQCTLLPLGRSMHRYSREYYWGWAQAGMGAYFPQQHGPTKKPSTVLSSTLWSCLVARSLQPTVGCRLLASREHQQAYWPLNVLLSLPSCEGSDWNQGTLPQQKSLIQEEGHPPHPGLLPSGKWGVWMNPKSFDKPPEVR